MVMIAIAQKMMNVAAAEIVIVKKKDTNVIAMIKVMNVIAMIMNNRRKVSS